MQHSKGFDNIKSSATLKLCFWVMHLGRDLSLSHCVNPYVENLLASKASLLWVLIESDFKNGRKLNVTA